MDSQKALSIHSKEHYWKRDEGTIQVIANFLTAYRTGPNPIVPDGESVDEAVFERSIRTLFDATLPPKSVNVCKLHQNIWSFNVSDIMVIKSYLGKNRWEPVDIGKRMGNVLYKMRGTTGRRIRHINQIHTEKRTLNTVDRRVSHPMEILADNPMTGTPRDIRI